MSGRQIAVGSIPLRNCFRHSLTKIVLDTTGISMFPVTVRTAVLIAIVSEKYTFFSETIA